MSNETKEFGKWRSLLWPIHGHELKKLLPMFFMFFFISFNYTVLRDTKDSLIVPNAGAEAITFLKVYGVVPAALIFMFIYSKLANVLSKQRLFYTTILPFIVFFGLFPIVIYPNIDVLHPVAAMDSLEAVLPEGFSGLIGCFKNWTFSLFYICSELWGSVVLSLLFWGFANDITKVTEAKRFYSLFGIGANVALMVSGPLIYSFSRIRDTVPAGVDAWGVTLNYLMAMVVFSGFMIIAIYWWINKNVLTDPRFFNPDEVKGKKKKPKMSMTESFKYLASSPYILCLAVLVISYGISINLVEVTWKNQLKLQYPHPNDYSAYMGMFSFWTGVITVLMMLFVGSNVIRRLGWGVGAMITPVVLLVTGIAFFGFTLFRDNLGEGLNGLIASLGATPLLMAVWIGMVQNIMSKSCKYSLFDPTKEMAYIPLDQEQKVKGKAAIDVVGARLGKSGGALMQQGMIVAFGSITAITPYIGAILLVIIAGWLIAAKSLNKQFITLTSKDNTVETKAETVSAGTKGPEPAPTA